MKMKLLLFLGILVGSVSLSLLSSSATYAVGESYKWINETTIEASGGAFGSTVMKSSPGTNRAVPVGTVQFTRDGSSQTFRAPTDLYTGSASGGSGTTFSSKCDLQLSINATAVNGGKISTNDADKRECSQTNLTEALTIADTNKGPTPENLGVGAAVTTGPGATPSDEAAAVSSCGIDGIGWILCPVLNFMASIVDGAYGFVASLLVVKPLISDTGPAKTSIYGAWSVMRNFANIAFVIAFMLIIFSQLTSFGLNNYGIKKMLPRLIVAAILVNASFWICALAVDISNILGASLNGLFDAIPKTGEAATANPGFDMKDPAVTGEGWQGIVGFVLAGGILTGAVLYVTLSALLPALLAALVAIATVFIVLTIRQALIILLIVVSPLAFVAYLLPNTESLYKKWLGLFRTLLLMFPIIAMIFGASALASKIVMTSADGPYEMAIQIMGALIAIIPLALTPIVMKTAGGLLNRIGGVVNNPNKGPVDKLRKGAEGFRDRRQAIAGARRMDRGKRALNMTSTLSDKVRGNGSSRFRGRAANVLGSTALGSAISGVASSGATVGYEAQQKNENAKRALTDIQQDYVANRAATDLRYAQSIAGPTGDADKLQSSALAAVQNRKLQEIKDEHVKVDKLSPAELATIIHNNDPNNQHSEAKVSASIEAFIKQASTKEVEDIVNQYATDSSEKSVLINQTLAKTLAQDGPQFLKGSDFGNIARGQLGKGGVPATLTEIAATNMEQGVYAEERLAAAPKDELLYSLRIANARAASGNTKARDNLRRRAQALKVNENLKGKIKHNEDAIDAMAL